MYACIFGYWELNSEPRLCRAGGCAPELDPWPWIDVLNFIYSDFFQGLYTKMYEMVHCKAYFFPRSHLVMPGCLEMVVTFSLVMMSMFLKGLKVFLYRPV